MLKRLIFGAGMAYLARRFMGGRGNRSLSPAPRTGMGMGGSRWGRRGFGF